MSSTLSSSEHDQATKAVRAATVFFFLNGLGIGSWLPRLAEIRDTLSLTEDVLGRALVGMGLGGLIGSFAVGLLAERVSTRTLTAVSGALLMLLLPLIGFGVNAWALFGALFVIGMADAVVDIGMNAQVVHAQDLLGRSNINRVHGIWSVGTLTGGLLGTAAAALGIGLKPQLVAFAVVGLALTAWASRDLMPFDAPADKTVSRRSFGLAAVLLGVVALATAVLEGSSAEWSSLMLADERGATDSQAGLGFVVFSAAMLFSRMIADRVVERIGARTTMIGGSTLVGLGTAGVVVAPNVLLTLVGYAIVGFGVAPLFPLLYETAARSASAGTGLAVMSSGMRIGFFGAPPVIGAIAAATNLRLAVTIVLGIAAAISLAHGLRQPTN